MRTIENVLHRPVNTCTTAENSSPVCRHILCILEHAKDSRDLSVCRLHCKGTGPSAGPHYQKFHAPATPVWGSGRAQPTAVKWKASPRRNRHRDHGILSTRYVCRRSALCVKSLLPQEPFLAVMRSLPAELPHLASRTSHK